MKAIINGVQYDTENAKVLEDRENTCPQDDPAWYRESLCQTPEGSYFLFGEGGALSWYFRVDEYGTKEYGTNIIPLSALQADAWRNHTFELNRIF